MKNILDVTFYGSFIAALIALPFFFINWSNYMLALRRRPPLSRSSVPMPIVSISFFVVSIVVAAAVATFATSLALRETRQFLNQSTGPMTVFVNGAAVAKPRPVIAALTGIAPYWAHHSYPTRPIRVEVLGAKGYLVLELRRDSDRPREYWVFVPSHGITSSNEIGRITTSVFDSYR